MHDNAATDRLRVIHVAPGLEMGGLEKLLVELARHTDRRRFDLRFVALGGRGLPADEIEAAGWPVTTLGKANGFRPGLVLTLARLFHRWGADVVHTHDDRPHIYATFAARLAGVRRIIHTRHGRSSALSRRQSFLVQLAGPFVDRFVCVSEDSARLAVQQGLDAERVGTLWNGIDSKRFAYAEPRDGPVVAVARLSPEKDMANLVRAAALAVAADPQLRVEIAGSGPCLPQLQQLVAEHGLAQHVFFLGQVCDVPGLLARAGLFVLPSLSEGVSLTLLEAMAGGVPVVATRVGGTPEVVADGVTGLLVPPADPSALAAALLRLRRDPAERQRLARAARRRVQEAFEVRGTVAAYENIYLGLAAPLVLTATTC